MLPCSYYQRLLSLTLLCLLVSCCVAWRRPQRTRPTRFRGRVNCEIYVYAPRCRGVAAKRALQPDSLTDIEAISEPQDLEEALLQSYRVYHRSKEQPKFPSPSLLGLLSKQLSKAPIQEEKGAWSEEEETYPSESLDWSATEDLNTM